MKILRVTCDLYPGTVGGLGIHAHTMSNYQVDLGHDVTVYTSLNPKLIDNKTKPNYKIITFKDNMEILGNHFCFHLLGELKNNINNFDIIHAHSHLFFYTNFCALANKRGSPPLVITNHGIRSASAPEWFNSAYMRTIGKWTLNSANRIVCYTEEEKDWFIKKLKIDGDKIIVIPNGVDTKLFCPKVDRSKRTNTILWNGRFVSGKRVDFLLRAVKKITTTFPNLRVLLVGEGPLKGEIEKSIRELNLENIVTIKNFVPYEEMPKLYQNSDIFVLPSLHEGVPRSILEAMSCGIPVIITEFDHLKDLIEDSGLMFQKNDVNDLSKCIITLINDRKLALEMGNNGRRKVSVQYSWQNTVLKTLELYESMI